MIAEEWYAAHECDVRDVYRFTIIGIATIADSQSMVDGDA